MKRLLGWMIVALLALAPASFAGTLTKQERQELIRELKKSEKMLKDATRGLTHAQWTYKTSPDRWSVQDCLEHLTLAEGFLRDRVQNGIMKAPATAPDPNAKETDAFVLKVITDRSQKATAPEPLRPSGKWATPQAMLKEFEARRRATIEYVRTTQDDLPAHKAPSPVGRDFDTYQWLLLISAHTERHAAQALEVKADPSFPRKKPYGNAE